MDGKNFLSANRDTVRTASPQSSSRRVIILALAVMVPALALAGTWTPARAIASVSAQAVVRQVIDRALPVLRDRQTPLPARRRQLRGLLESHFDFQDMARIALGYHWRQLNPSQ